MINERDKAVLCDLSCIADKEGIEFFVIGAGARFLAYDWPRRIEGGRGTTDWDIAVRVSSWGDFERLKDALTSSEAQFETTAAEHRLRHVRGRSLDVVPFGGVEAPDRTVTYPHGETRTLCSA
jgi:predicted nucleotidyltransferase